MLSKILPVGSCLLFGSIVLFLQQVRIKVRMRNFVRIRSLEFFTLLTVKVTVLNVVRSSELREFLNKVLEFLLPMEVLLSCET